jgi:flagellar biosynthesis protein FlhB
MHRTHHLWRLNRQKRLERISHALKRLFYIVLPFVIILLVTAIFMIKAYGLSHTDFKALTYAKEGIWTIMFLNLLAMMFRRNKADKLLSEGDFVGAKNQLELIGKFMVPLNIILGVSAIAIGSYFSSNL